MILYTCPHCNNSSMYPDDLRGDTICRSCGQSFELSQFSRTKPNQLVTAVRRLMETARRAKRSPVSIYLLVGIVTAAIVWAVLSIFGFIPDEIRLMNRRFVSVADWDRVKLAVGLVAVGVPNDHGQIVFVGYGTAWAVSNDGFMITSKHVVLPIIRLPDTPLGPIRTWVYIDKRRIDAEIVWTDTVSDIALLKVDDYLPYRFKVGGEGSVRQLNVEVHAIGFQEMPAPVESTAVDTELASTEGTISRVYQDAAGTLWLEHTAALKAGSSGGPLLLGDHVVGINNGGEGGIYQALNMTVYREKIWNVIKERRNGPKAKSS